MTPFLSPRRGVFAAFIAWGTLLSASASSAAPPTFASQSAKTTSAGRLELGVFSPATYGLTDRVELAAHPAGLFLYPSLRIKANWWQGGYFECRDEGAFFAADTWLSTQHRLGVPSPLLDTLAREGSGGLLPNNTEVPFALTMTHHLIVSRAFGRHTLSGRAGFSISFRENTDLPMIEFPFLYSTLASLHAPLVGHFGLAVEGPIAWRLDYEFSPVLHLFQPRADVPWPATEPPLVFSQETKASLHLRLGTRHRVSLGAALAVARYPIGTRAFWLPTLDYRAVLF